ncbi:hypothetical protein [Nocardia arizonensis]|uniref:hypothetical protein n=1 Tax=Nocardia arizonensis TaxID=1141647 RepID=UPI0006D251A6|nr:hypothetical protein [Nocardia arizonensis]
MSTRETRPAGDTIVIEFDELDWARTSDDGAVSSRSAATPAGKRIAELARRLHRGTADAHRDALAAQQALQLLLVRGLGDRRVPPPRAVPASGRWFDIDAGLPVERTDPPPGPHMWPPRRTAFEPLARSKSRALDRDGLAALTRGDLAAAFGPAYAQPGCNDRVALAATDPLVLTAVTDLDHRGGASGQGSCRARLAASPHDARSRVTAARQAVEALALYLGLTLCFADCELAFGLPDDAVSIDLRTPTMRIDSDAPSTAVHVEVVSVDLVPLPWLAADVTFVADDGTTTAVIRGLGTHARPRPGAVLGPGPGGVVTEFLGRFNADGVPAMLSEFNIAHIAHGDQALAMGPEFGRFSDIPAVRLPSRDLLLVDRVMSLEGTRGGIPDGAGWRTEYDSPPDAWYYRESANAGMPNCVFMEFSLQAAAFLGPYLGGTLLGGGTESLRLRNLEGRASVLREVELRGATIGQRSAITSTSITPGALLQEFAYESSVGGEPFYRGTSLFGYFNDEALDNQIGLDGGRETRMWLAGYPHLSSRTIDVAARRRAENPRVACSTGRLALLDTFSVVDGGGSAGLGYLHAVQQIDPSAWYFDQHFYLDPVIPGSLGVETIIQAIQEWAVDTGLDDGLDRPEFVVPVGVELRWKYRGQFLRTDTPMRFEVHILNVERRPGRVRIIAEASIWKPGMRIYWLEQVPVELRAKDAPAW